MDGTVTSIEPAGDVILAEINHDQVVAFSGSLRAEAIQRLSVGDRCKAYGTTRADDVLIADRFQVLGPPDEYGGRYWQSYHLSIDELAELGIRRAPTDTRAAA